MSELVYKMTVNVLGASRGKMESGAKYASVIVSSPTENAEGSSVERFGLAVMKIACDFATLDGFKEHDFPSECELTAVLKAASGGKSQPHIKAIKLLGVPRSQPTKPTGAV